MALRNYNTREENEMQEQKQLQDLEKEMEKYPQIQSLAEARLLLSKERRYGIYQFKEGSFAETYAFMNMNYIMDHNITIHKETFVYGIQAIFISKESKCNRPEYLAGDRV